MDPLRTGAIFRIHDASVLRSPMPRVTVAGLAAHPASPATPISLPPSFPRASPEQPGVLRPVARPALRFATGLNAAAHQHSSSDDDFERMVRASPLPKVVVSHLLLAPAVPPSPLVPSGNQPLLQSEAASAASAPLTPSPPSSPTKNRKRQRTKEPSTPPADGASSPAKRTRSSAQQPPPKTPPKLVVLPAKSRAVAAVTASRKSLSPVKTIAKQQTKPTVAVSVASAAGALPPSRAKKAIQLGARQLPVRAVPRAVRSFARSLITDTRALAVLASAASKAAGLVGGLVGPEHAAACDTRTRAANDLSSSTPPHSFAPECHHRCGIAPRGQTGQRDRCHNLRDNERDSSLSSGGA